MVKERVTVDFDSESYYLDGEYWESWDHFGEEMADSINKEFNKLAEENNQLKQELKKVYDDDYYLKQFIIAIINIYSKNNGISPTRLEMIWDASDMDKTSLKHLKSSFYKQCMEDCK